MAPELHPVASQSTEHALVKPGLEHLLRAPAALLGVADPAIADQIADLERPTAHDIACRALGIDRLSDWQSGQVTEAPSALVKAAATAAEMVALSQQQPYRPDSVEAALEGWLAMALPELHDEWFGGLLADSQARRRATIVACYAHYDSSEATTRLAGALPGGLRQLSANLADLGEVALIEHVSTAAGEPSDQIEKETLLHGQQEPASPSADIGLEAAWEAATERAAQLADLMAIRAAERGEALLALQASERAHKTVPTPLRAATVAVAHLQMNQIDQALALTTESPESGEGWIARGLSLAAAGMPEAAEAALQAAHPFIAQLPPFWLRNLYQGMRSGLDRGAAVAVLQTALDQAPADVELRAELAEQLLAAQAFDQAALHAEVLLALQPQQIDRHKLAAALKRGLGDHQGALTHWLEIAEHEPTAKQAVVKAAIEAEDIATALTFAQELIQADPADAGARIALGTTLIASGNMRGGLIHLRKAAELEPNDSQTWKALAEAQLVDGDQDGARASLAAGAAACPQSADIQILRAELASAESRWTDVVEAAEQALSQQASLTEARWLLAQAQRELGERHAAIDNYRQVLAAQPSRLDVKMALIGLLADEQQPIRAAELAATVEASGLSPAAHYLLGRVLAAGPSDLHDARAIQHLMAAKDAGEQDQALDYWIGRAHQQAGQPHQAMSAYQFCLKAISDEADDLKRECTYRLAQAALEADQAPVAISVLESARTAGALSAQGYGLLATTYMSAGLAGEAVAPALQACELAPDDADLLDLAVDVALAAGEPESVLERVKNWRGAQDIGAHAWLQARVFARMNEPDNVRRAVASAVYPDRNNVDSQSQAGQLLLAVGEAKSALRWFERALRAQPDSAQIKHSAAQAAAQSGKHGLAEQLWQELTEARPEQPEFALGAAEALWQQGKRAAAIGQMQRALSLAPEDAALHARLARAHMANGETAKALEQYQAAALGRPQDLSIVEEAVRAMLDIGEPAKALALAQESFDSMPDDPDWLMLKAEAALAAGQPQLTLSSIGRIPREQRTLDCRGMLALALAASGDWEGAATALRDAIEHMQAGQSAWVARAAMQMGRWPQAVSAVSGQAAAPMPWIDRFITTVRVLDAGQLISRYGGADESDSVSAWVPQSLIDSLMADMPATFSAAEVAAFNRRLRQAQHGGEQPSSTQIDPDLPRNLRLQQHAVEGLALAHLAQGQQEEALETLARSGHDAHGGRWGALLAGIAHHQAGRGEMARKAWGSIDGAPWMLALAVYLTARSWQDEHNLEAAINALNQAVLLDPQAAAWQHLLGQLYVRAGRFEAAVAHLQQAAETNPESAVLQRDLASALTNAGQLSEAHAAYAKSMKSMAADPQVLTEFADVSMAIGDARAALARYRQALALRPDDAQALIGAAQASLKTGNHRSANQYATKALRRAPADANVLRSLAEVLLATGKAQQALAALDSAASEAEPDPAIGCTRARVLTQMGRAPEAIELLQQIVDTDQEHAEAWALLADAFQAVGRPQDALDAVRMALENDPKHPDYRLRMGQLFRLAGQLDQSLAELSALAEQSPTDARVAYETGLVHKARREQAHALQAFERAIELDYRLAPAHFEAGLALKSLKSYARAAQAFQAVVDLDPQNSEALHQLAAVQALALVHDNPQPVVSS